MTADDERRFFSLLRAGLWDKDVELCLFGSPVDWQSLLEQGRKQTVLGVLADGIGKLPPALRPPFPIHRSLQQELLHIRQGHILLNHVLQEIWEKLACAGIRPVLLKGQGMAQYYVCPEQRQCGDIDLYVGPEQYDHACQVLKKYGKPTGEENESSKHRHFHRNGVIIEIHRLAGTFSDPLTNKRFQRLTRTYLHEDGYCFEKLKGTDVSLPPVNFDALFLFFTWLVISSTVVSVCDKCATGLFSCLPVRQTSTRNVCHGKSVFCIWKILAIIRRYRCRLSGIIRKRVS